MSFCCSEFMDAVKSHLVYTVDKNGKKSLVNTQEDLNSSKIVHLTFGVIGLDNLKSCPFCWKELIKNDYNQN